MEISPGAYHFRRFLDIDRQRALADHCRALVDGAVSFEVKGSLNRQTVFVKPA